MFDEMHGITDGANAALKEKGDDYRVNFEDVYAISEGIDGLFSFVGQFLFGPDPDAEMLSEIAELVRIIGAKEAESIFKIDNGKLVFFPNRKPFPFIKFGCNGFMLTGDATSDGKTYMGRDFMFSTADVLQDESCVMVYLPEKGTGNSFVTVAPPSFVGQCVGINSEGLSVGIDISLSGAFSRDTGVGGLIILRELLQNTSGIDQAVSRFRKFERGIPWNFVVAAENGSQKYGKGVVFEVGRNDLGDDYLSSPDNGIPPEKGFTGPDVVDFVNLGDLLLFNEMKSALKQAGSEDLNPDGTVKDGTMVRGATWIYPDIDIFKDNERGRGTNKDVCNLADIDSYKSYYSSGYKFHEQGESDDDVMIVTNHFIIPRMRMAQFHPIINYGYNMGALGDMTWRYEYMEQLIDDNYGKISFFGTGDFPEPGTAGWIIDFLNPNFIHPGSTMPNGMKADYYVPKYRDVDGIHAVMNNTDKELKCLFGYLPDPWVGIKLMPLVNWWYSQY
jgi:hypothetical protein